MIKYPLYVTLDTNIFDANHYNFSEKSNLGLLRKHVKDNKIKIVLSDIVLREASKHIKQKTVEARCIFKKAIKDAGKVFPEEFLKTLGFENNLFLPDEKVLTNQSFKEFENFIEDIQVEKLDMSQINFIPIVDDYFEINPPFENNKEKRKEFPDAIIAYEIKQRFDNSETVAIVSNDDGLKQALQSHSSFLFFSNLHDLYGALSKRDKDYDKAVAIIDELSESILEQINEYIDDDCIEVRGLSYDKDGVSYGYDYDEYYLKEYKIKSIRLHVIDDIDENIIRATLSVTGNFTADCYYNDFDNAWWDSEEKEYICVDTLHFIEKHKTRFACTIEVSRESKDIFILPFKAILGVNSRVSSYNYDETQEVENEYYDSELTEMGFQPLSKYADYLVESLPNSGFGKSIIKFFESINKIGRKYEEISNVYAELSEIISSDIPFEKQKVVVENFSEVDWFPVNIEDLPEKNQLFEIKNWADEKFETVSKISEKLVLPDYIEYGKTYVIAGANGINYQLSLDKLENCPERGDNVFLYVNLYDVDNNSVITGNIELTVGYQEFDEEGNAGYGVSDSIEYHCDNIITAMNDILNALQEDYAKEESIAQRIKDIIGSNDKT